MAASILRLTAGGPRPTNTRGMGAVGNRIATAEGAGLCTKSAIAQTDGARTSLQEVGHGQVPDMLAKGVGQARYGRVLHVQIGGGGDTALLWPGGHWERNPRNDGLRPTGVAAEHGSRLGNVVGKKCTLAISMRSQGGSITNIQIISDNLDQGVV